MKRTRRTFSPEFKAKAIKLMKAGRQDVTQIARELDVPRQMLYAWTRQAESRKGKPLSDIFPGRGKRGTQEAELARLRRRIAQLEEDKEILVKASAFFAKHRR